jgi:hypothetical protein
MEVPDHGGPLCEVAIRIASVERASCPARHKRCIGPQVARERGCVGLGRTKTCHGDEGCSGKKLSENSPGDHSSPYS